jgi:peptidoglycan lytic transglycosylase
MSTTLKVMLASGAVVAYLAASAGRANAEPVVSSWYGPGLEGNPTASGEPFRSEGYTAAHRSLPFGTKLLVTYGQRQTVVRVTDRGPYVAGRDMDLSQAAAQEIGLTTAGADAVDVRVLNGSEGQGATRPAPAAPMAPTAPASGKPRSLERKPDGIAELLQERPYLRVLGAEFAPYSRPSTRVCQEASNTMPTPTIGSRLPSVESRRALGAQTISQCAPKMRAS